MFKKAQREWDLYISKGAIRAYDDAGRLVADVRQVSDDIFRAEDYRAGWISPDLDWLGAWNLARELGATKEDFEKAFGIDVDSDTIVVDIKTFVSWFFRAGELPVKLDDGMSGILPDIVTGWITDLLVDDVIAYAEEQGYIVDSEAVRYCVEDIVDIVGMVDKMSDGEIFNELLWPVFENDIEISGNKVVVRGNFIDVCKKREGQLIEYLQDYFLDVFYSRDLLNDVIDCADLKLEDRDNIE
jgi:hypothetical protein